MRIAFDASAMPARRAGAGMVMYRLGRALAGHAAEHPLLLIDRFRAFDDLRDCPGVTLAQAPPVGRAARALWEQAGLPPLVARWDADLLHGLHHSLPLRRAARAAVVTVHDLTFDLLPRRYTPARRWYMRAATRLGLLRADRVIVPSGWVGRALVRRYRVPPERVHVIPLAPAVAEAPVTDAARLADVRRRYALPERFLLSVGTREPGKNRAVLRAAGGELARRGLALPLLVAGQRGWLEDDAGDGEGVRLLGYVPDADLAALYSLATVFLFPSWLEGFGLPPLEALACGAPVVAADRPAMPEVLGGAALYADPRRPRDWADAVERLVTDGGLRARMVERGRARAARYSWERTARETLAVYEAALADAARRGGWGTRG